MARKKPKGKGAVFTAFNVTYEDGMVTSNRRVANELLDQMYGDSFQDLARKAIEDQDDEIAKRSGQSRAEIKSIIKA
jgi:hypothetical protein